MILLGINGGLGNTDCASLHLSHVDLEAGWLDFPRPKTEIDRRIPLWPETVDALKKVIANRRQASGSEYANLVFLTRLGQPWVRFDLEESKDADGKVAVTAKSDDAIAKAMRKLLDDLGLYRRGVTFYALRHTFETIAGGCRDQVAVDAVMGHVDASMAADYREHIEEERLKAVTDHVRTWLFPKPTKASPKSSAKASSSKPATRKRTTTKAPARPARREVAEGTLLRIVG
jgi:integrase